MEKSLFHIQQEYLTIAEQLEESGGELTPELEEALQINQADLQVKAANYLTVIDKLQAEVDMAKQYEARAKAYRARKEKAIDRLKSSLQMAVEAFGPQQVGITKLSLRKSEAVEVIDQEELPPMYLATKVTTAPDKAAIKKAIKSGESVPGATIRESQNLQIK